MALLNSFVFLIYCFMTAILSAMNVGYLEGMGKAWNYNLAIMITSLISTIPAVMFMLSEISKRTAESRDTSYSVSLKNPGFSTVAFYESVDETFGNSFFQTTMAAIFTTTMITLTSLMISDLRSQGNFSNLSSFNKITLGSQIALSVIYMLLLIGFSYSKIKDKGKKSDSDSYSSSAWSQAI